MSAYEFRDGMTLSPIITLPPPDLSICMLIVAEHWTIKLQLRRERKRKIDREGVRERKKIYIERK